MNYFRESNYIGLNTCVKKLVLCMYYPNEGHICSTIIRALGTGEGQAPLEFRFYRVKFFKMGKISSFVSVGPTK